jgi:hypothetical protein
MHALLVPNPIGRGVSLAGAQLLLRGRRRLRGEPRAVAHLHRIVDAFAHGFQSACADVGTPALHRSVEALPLFHRGFAYEGAAMAAGLLDWLRPWSAPKWPQLLTAAPQYAYLLYVGAGWALARRQYAEGSRLDRLDPILKWLAVDGVGFHDGFLRPERSGLPRREGLSSYGARAYDQGLGRSLWFSARLRTRGIAGAIAQTDRERHGDLWSGVGLACAYAGGVTRDDIGRLAADAGFSRADLAQGVAFAAEAHVRGANDAPPHTLDACEVICGMTPVEAAAIVRTAAIGAAPTTAGPAYEVWRMRVRARWS